MTIVVTEKWGHALNGAAITDTWIEPFNGDFNVDPANGRMALASNRHHGGLNSVFFGGHAKWYSPGVIDASATLTGCNLVHRYPVLTGSANDMCDAGVPGCGNTGPANICNHFSYR